MKGRNKLQTLITVTVLYTLISFSDVSGDDDMKGFSVLNLEHAFGSDGEEYIKRGTVTILSLKSGEAQYIEDDISPEERTSIKDLVANNGDYKIRLTPKNLPPNTLPTSYASSFVKACLLYESRLEFTISINVDPVGNVLGVSLRPSIPHCTGEKVPDDEITHFRASVEVVQTAAGPQPETLAYIQKLEEEKAAKAKGQNQDNRSFFAKYWMYLVPVVIILMFASSDPNAGGGGSGR